MAIATASRDDGLIPIELLFDPFDSFFCHAPLRGEEARAMQPRIIVGRYIRSTVRREAKAKAKAEREADIDVIITITCYPPPRF